MAKRTKTFEIEYTYFEPRTLVTPIDWDTTLELGRVYTIIECYEPETVTDLCICYVRETWGHKYKHMSRVFTNTLRGVQYSELNVTRTRVVVDNG